MKIVLLLRADIFSTLGLQNLNTKFKNNSVNLDWKTSYSNHRKSIIFKLIDNVLKENNKKAKIPEKRIIQIDSNITKETKNYWDNYFPWDTKNLKDEQDYLTSFVSFLRLSYYRPRDILTMLECLKETSGSDSKNYFTQNDFENPEFLRNYSNHLLGEIKDQLTFYYTENEYEIFLKFFQHLNGQDTFNYSDYLKSFANFNKYLETINNTAPRFMSTANDFLQFLYTLNIICYWENLEDENGKVDKHFHYNFRERTFSNIMPKVKTEANYQVFSGLTKSLSLGKLKESKNK